jgi:hypothetical protein
LLQSADQIEIEGTASCRATPSSRNFPRTWAAAWCACRWERREALETLPWVEQAHVQRVLPNRIRVEITERTPVAFLRTAKRSFPGGFARRDPRPARRRRVSAFRW